MKTRFHLFLAVMVSVFALASSCIVTARDAFKADEASCQELKDQVIKSKVMDREVKYNVLLPAGYDKSKTYNVIYLLHGMYGNNGSWLKDTKLADKMSSAIKNGVIDETIVIMPQAWNCFYFDSDKVSLQIASDKLQYETFFFTEFIPYIEKEFNIKSERTSRAVAGLSMGGFGSLIYGLGHPEMFCYVYAMSPAYFEPIPTLAANADKDALPYIRIANGNNDRVVGTTPRQCYEMLVKNKVDAAYEEWGGGHDWVFWDQCVNKFLSEIGAAFRQK